MKKTNFIICLLLFAVPSMAENNPVGTWSGTWYNSPWSGALSFTLSSDNSMTGTFEQPLEPYGLSGKVSIPLLGTYSYNTVNGWLTFTCEGSTVVQGYNTAYYLDGSGYVIGDNASGDYWLTSYYYEGENWWLLDDNDHGTWNVVRPSGTVILDFDFCGANFGPADGYVDV